MKSVGLSGFIFGCTESTERECRHRGLFGLPGKHRTIVQSIPPDTPLFLFNYDRRVLYGVFYSKSRGGWNLSPGAWRGKFPSQIRVRGISTTVQHGEILTESHFRPVISNNYFAHDKFSYSLTSAQVSRLMELFRAHGWDSNSNAARSLRTEIHQKSNPPRASNWRKGSRPFMINKHTKRSPIRRSKPAPHCFRQHRQCFTPLPGCYVIVDENFTRRHQLSFGKDRYFNFHDQMPGGPPSMSFHGPVKEFRNGAFYAQAMYPVMPRTYLLPPAPVTPPSLRPVRPPLVKKKPKNKQPKNKEARNKEPQKITNHSWNLSEHSWKDAESFKAFISGKELEAPNDSQIEELEPPDDCKIEEMEPPDESKDEELDLGLNGGPEEGEITEDVMEVDSISSDEVVCLGPMEGVQEEPLERKVSLVKYNLTRNFGVIME